MVPACVVRQRIYRKMAEKFADWVPCKTAASRWKTELLKWPIAKLLATVRQRTSFPLPTDSYLRVKNRQLQDGQAQAMLKDIALRSLRGDAKNLEDVARISADRDVLRRTLRYEPIGRPVSVTSIPHKRTRAFHGTSRAGEIVDVVRDQKGQPQMVLRASSAFPGEVGTFYGARSEFAAPYSKGIGQRHVSYIDERAMSGGTGPRPIGPRLLGEYNIKDIAPKVWHSAEQESQIKSEIAKRFAEKMRLFLDERKRSMRAQKIRQLWASLTGKKPVEISAPTPPPPTTPHPMWHRSAPNGVRWFDVKGGRSMEDILRTRAAVVDGTSVPYEGVGTAQAVPVRRLWAVREAKPGEPPHKLNLRRQQKALEQTDAANPHEVVTPIRLLESEKMPEVRMKSFLERYRHQ